MTEQQRDSLISEFKGLNLNKFIQEAVTSIIEAKLKASIFDLRWICNIF